MKKYVTGFVMAILAGVSIAVGGAVYLAAENKVVGAVFFSVGLFTVCTKQLNLFTGKAVYLFDNKPKFLIDLVIIWAGNFVGAWAVAALLSLTRQAERLGEAASTLAQTKTYDSLLSLFILGVFCNVCIYFAVYSYGKNAHELGKYVGIVFGVTAFILAGFEHSVADMFYFAVAGRLLEGRALLCLLVVTLGNVVGGVLFPLGIKLKEYLTESKKIGRILRNVKRRCGFSAVFYHFLLLSLVRPAM